LTVWQDSLIDILELLIDNRHPSFRIGSTISGTPLTSLNVFLILKLLQGSFDFGAPFLVSTKDALNLPVRHSPRCYNGFMNFSTESWKLIIGFHVLRIVATSSIKAKLTEL